MITREQVADLREGDVVRVSVEGTITRDDSGELRLLTGQTLAFSGGDVASWVVHHDLTVVSRAPRPLYVNHPRTEPVPGDVAVCADGAEPPGNTYHYLGDEDGAHWWRFDDRMKDAPPKVMRLLVDGETGEVVP